MHPLTDSFIKGRSKLKKIQGKYFDRFDKPRKACHYGAMYYGYYGDTDIDAGLVRMKADFPELINFVPIPCEHSKEWGVGIGWISSILIHLNDVHDGRGGWTDQKVAEWLETAFNQTAQKIEIV